jgi:cyclophilin family peptidyl-prolyl cis-trans isomerase
MSVTLHTNLGDLKMELFCEQVAAACKELSAAGAMAQQLLSPAHMLYAVV